MSATRFSHSKKHKLSDLKLRITSISLKSQVSSLPLRLIPIFLMMIVLGASLAFYSDSQLLILPFLAAMVLATFTAMDYTLYIMVASLPFSFRFIFAHGTEMQFPAEPLLAIMSAALILRWVIMGRKGVLVKFPFRLPMLLYIASLYLSMINVGQLYYSVKGSIRAVIYMMLALVVFHVITDRRRLKWLFIASVVPAIVAVGWTMISLIDRLSIWRWSSAYEGLLFTSYIHYGSFVAVIFLILLGRSLFDKGKYDRVAWKLLLVFYGMAICLSFSRGVWLSLIASLGFLLVQKSSGIKQKKVFIVGGAVAFFAIVLSIPYASNLLISRIQTMTNFGYASNKTRILRWGFALVMFLRHPIIGNGYNSFKFTYVNNPNILGPYLSQFRMGAHNEYLQTLAEMGLIGFFAWMWIIVSFFRYGFGLLRKLKSAEEQSAEEHQGTGSDPNAPAIPRSTISTPYSFYRSIVIGVMAAEFSLLVHFLVNNLIQTHIVGIPFWLLIGILPTIGNILEKESKPPAKA